MSVNKIFLFAAVFFCLHGFGMKGSADEPACPPCEKISTATDSKPTSIFDGINRNKAKIWLYGWVQAGISVDEYGSQNRYTSSWDVAPVHRQLEGHSANSHLLMLEQQSDFKLNQLWFGAQRLLDTQHGFDWGFQTDVAYGTDLRYCQSFNDRTFDYDWGQGDYYLSVVSLYGDVGYKNLSVRAGKFNSEMSNESFSATETFFYTKAYAFFDAPTVSGVRATYRINDRWSVFGAWIAGENTSFENRFDDNGLLFQIRFQPTKSTSLKYSYLREWNNGLNKRSDAASGFGRDFLTQDMISHHVVFTWDINSRWRHAAEGFTHSRLMNRNEGDATGFANGFNLNLYYKINDRWTVGGRYEWLRARNTLYDLPYLTNGGHGTEINTLALAVNWYPLPRLNLRSELRYDWTDYVNGYRPFDNATQSDQLIFGCAMTVKF